MTEVSESGGIDPTEIELIEDLFIEYFGLGGPFAWTEALVCTLQQASDALDKARAHHADAARDSTEAIDAAARDAVRAASLQYLGSVFGALESMPILQQRPQILRSLQFIVAEIASIDRGVRPDWLEPPSSKKHYKRLAKEAEWVPIIAAVELASHLSTISTDDAARRYVQNEKKSLKCGTIYDWQRKLLRDDHTSTLRREAKLAIQLEIMQMKAALLPAKTPEARDDLLKRRIRDLLQS